MELLRYVRKLDDGERAVLAIKKAAGKGLRYREPARRSVHLPPVRDQSKIDSSA